MIELIGPDFSIKIQDDNPAYKTLSKFVGESVAIHKAQVEANPQEPVEEEKKPPKVYETVDRERVFSEFLNSFPWANLDENEQPLVFNILKNHLTQVLGSEKGSKSMEKIEENIYKSGDLYLVTK
jgi:hypothetical protein